MKTSTRFIAVCAATVLASSAAFAQFRADDRSVITSSPAPAYGITHQTDGLYTDGRGQNAPALFTATNVLHQGTTAITVTFTPAAQASWGANPLANESAPMIFLGARVYKTGTNFTTVTAGTVQAPEGNFDWGGNTEWPKPSTALAMTKIGNSFRTAPFNVRTVLPDTKDRTIARMMVIVKSPGDIRPCSDPAGCQQTDNREFTFAPTTIAGTSVRSAEEYIENATVTPNPFSDMAMISFSMKKPAPVTAKIYNMLGAEVRTILRNQEFNRGECLIQWDGNNNGGVEMTNGVYMYHLEIAGTVQTGRIVLNR
jgi:hypothetical protein